MDQQSIKKIFTRLKKNNPHPQTELQYHNAFELLIAVMLSAQATDISVNKVTPTLFSLAPTPQHMLDLGLDKVKKIIQSIGLYQTKAKHILLSCKILIDQYNGKVPDDRASLESLPGVGRKTANVILNTAFNHPVIAVDTHIFRVARRIGLATGNTPLAVEQDLMKCIPKNFLKDAHHWLILHGRYICKAKKPLCPQCPINDLCEYPDKTRD